MDIKNLLAYFVSSFNVKKFSYTTCAAWQWSVTLPRCEEVHITFKQNVTFGVKEDPRFEREVFIEGLEEIYMY